MENAEWSPDWQEKKKRLAFKLNGLTVAEIAEKMNCEVVTIYKYLDGSNNIPADKILTWCEVTGEKPETVNRRIYPDCCNSVMDEYFKRYMGNS